MEISLQLLERLTQADGAPGFEDAVRDVFVNELDGAGEIRADRTGSVICVRRGTAERPRVMLDCHLDEVGFIVQAVTAEGFLKFLPLGGWWGHLLLAQRVTVHAGTRAIPGVIGSTPPHFLSKERRTQVVEIQDMFIDVGAESCEMAESWGIRPGAWVVPQSAFTHLANEKLLLSKAFDNRVGCALAIEATRTVEDHPNTIFAAGCAQEEVGLRGARTATALIEPDVAIVLEGAPADDTPGFNPGESQGALGNGVQVRAYDPSMIANPRFVDLALATAREHDIPFQVTVRQSGGTNAGAIHLHDKGVPCLVLAVPSRYIHAHTSILHRDDYAAALRLVQALVRRLDAETVASL